MERSEVLEKVITAVVDTLDVEADAITEETTFAELDADSFDMLELLTTLEDEFDATVDDEKIADIASVGAAVDAILAAI